MQGKFTPAQMQKVRVTTQKIVNSQNKSTARYMGKRFNANSLPDTFESKTLKQSNTTNNPVMDILTGKIFQNKK